jgi:hypothetical protein
MPRVIEPRGTVWHCGQFLSILRSETHEQYPDLPHSNSIQLPFILNCSSFVVQNQPNDPIDAPHVYLSQSRS